MKETILSKETHKFKTPFSVLAILRQSVKDSLNRKDKYVLVDFKYSSDKGGVPKMVKAKPVVQKITGRYMKGVKVSSGDLYFVSQESGVYEGKHYHYKAVA